MKLELNKMSEAFNVIMVVDNLYNKCMNRDQSKQGKYLLIG